MSGEMSYEEFIEAMPRMLEAFRRRRKRLGRDPFRGYMPSAIDFVRRARSVEEALEVIEYLERRGEISKDEADRLRKKLREGSIEALGPRRSYGVYLRHAVSDE